jgi:hypothetical protein
MFLLILRTWDECVGNLNVQVEQGAIDFVYTNPSIFSCLESEFQLISLVTLRNLALGVEVDQFGGVIFSKAGGAFLHIVLLYLMSSNRFSLPQGAVSTLFKIYQDEGLLYHLLQH